MPSKPSSPGEPKGENSLLGYWRVYGGWTAILRSTYFWGAVVLTVAFPDLHTAVENGVLLWPQLTIGMIPTILGLGVGAMALMLSFSSGRFLEAIKQRGRDNSYLRKVMASFFHFATINIAALIVAYVGRTYSSSYLSIVGVFLTLYGVLLTMGIVSRIWHTARIFNKVADNDITP